LVQRRENKAITEFVVRKPYKSQRTFSEQRIQFNFATLQFGSG